MLSRVIAKNVGDVFLRHSVEPRPLHQFLRPVRQMISFHARMCLLGSGKLYISTPFTVQPAVKQHVGYFLL